MLPNPIDGVDVFDIMALALWLIHYSGALTWMNFFSDTVRNWRTIQYDEESQPVNDRIADWFKRQTPLAIQIIVFVVSWLLPIIVLTVLFVTHAIAFTTDILWFYVLSWFFAWLKSQARYQEIKEPPEVVLLEHPATPLPAGIPVANALPGENIIASREMG